VGKDMKRKVAYSLVFGVLGKVPTVFGFGPTAIDVGD
jgi:hypothetical protein